MCYKEIIHFHYPGGVSVLWDSIEISQYQTGYVLKVVKVIFIYYFAQPASQAPAWEDSKYNLHLLFLSNSSSEFKILASLFYFPSWGLGKSRTIGSFYLVSFAR